MLTLPPDFGVEPLAGCTWGGVYGRVGEVRRGAGFPVQG